MPRLNTPVAARPLFYDRNAAQQTLRFQANGVAPHALTVRATRTIPADTKSFIELISLEVFRATAAGTPVQPNIAVRYTPSGGAATELMRAALFIQQNTARDQNTKFVGGSMTIFEADVIDLATSDTSTTGTVSYEGELKATEFDT